ncbi:Crp/Fnr family transcriptional regulator [Pedobacter cryoconitis]|uniref:CRP-like cAMP-binding protein n=1 Tax=Pedobacter cryoconitis TaxID=188932 RepID=A0A7X0MHP3_9SPHI|nr:Crp/Fnr family transcriptional regulator [Pedobacter cryoconitis]MBB6499081.1 CRP-like cAMP-binding protein [Pedobacter cryoconitis]
MDLYYQKLEQFMETLDEETMRAVENVSVKKTFKKGDLLLEQGEICKYSFSLINGVARKFYYGQKKVITTEFYFAGDVALSFNSYLLQKPSEEVMECVTDLTVECISRDNFEKLKQSFPKLIAYDLLFTELYAAWLEERLFDFNVLSATERYRKLMHKSPQYFHQIKLTHIASYLGISLETLSRIRARI